jgi:signal transduction histidine kinase
MWRRTLHRPLQALAIVLLAACVVSIVGLALLAGRGRSRLRLVHARVEHSRHLLEFGLRAQQWLLAHNEPGQALDPAVVEELRGEVDSLAGSGFVDPENGARLRRLSELLDERGGSFGRDRLTQTVAVLNRVLESETAIQAELWRQIDEDATAELELVLGISIALPLLALGVYWFTLRWFLRPLVDLRRLLDELASGQRQRVAKAGIHPVLTPLFDNYNRLVGRLEELEEEHASHARQLEGRIREATRALLEQQATLARAERLAAVGETTAFLAHELRNPLAGILMSLGNLRADTTDANDVERLSAVIEEIERLSRLLNDALSSARHAPEASRELQLEGLVAELLTLLRYQVPPAVDLKNAVPGELHCVLPGDRLRQALLNLVINSVHALADRSGAVTVAAARRDDRVELIVEDDGPGFPPEMLRGGIKVFASHSAGGTGLGLAMVRRLAADLGGAVQLENRSPAGARVRLELPCGHG